MSDWTDEKLKTLVQMWPRNSPSAIAERLGMTRGQVNGKAFRLGLMDEPRPGGVIFQGSRGGAILQTVKAKQARAATPRVNDASHRANLPARQDIEVVVLSKTQTCQWPTSEDKPFTFCEDKSVQGKPYCPKHCKAAKGTGTPSERRADKGVEQHV